MMVQQISLHRSNPTTSDIYNTALGVWRPGPSLPSPSSPGGLLWAGHLPFEGSFLVVGGYNGVELQAVDTIYRWGESDSFMLLSGFYRFDTVLRVTIVICHVEKET